MTTQTRVSAASAPAGATADPGPAPLRGRWRLKGSVALRPEPFGALAYDFHTRRLSFLKTPTLVEVVAGLADADGVEHALDAAGVGPADRAAYRTALQSLARTGIIEPTTQETA